MKTRFTKPISTAVLAILLCGTALPSLVIGGCGGSGGKDNSPEAAVPGTRTTKATVRLKWPEPAQSRLIPVASNSVRITITNGTGFSATQVIARPHTNATFENLPPGALTITATAHGDMTGEAQPAQASGVQVVTAVADTPFALNLTLASTIDRLTLTAPTGSITTGQSAPLAASALDAAGNLILTSGTTYQWTSSDTTVATVESSGGSVSLTGVAAGTTTITVTETESGKTATLPLTIASASTPTSPTTLPKAVAFHLNPSHSGNTRFGKPLTFPASPTWSITLNAPVSYPLIADGKVFVITRNPENERSILLYALDQATGSTVWGPTAFASGQSVSPGITYDNGRVFILGTQLNQGQITAVDAATGTTIWSDNVAGNTAFYYSPPTAAIGLIYISGSYTEQMLTFHQGTGDRAWFANGPDGRNSPTITPQNDAVFLSSGLSTAKYHSQTGNTLWSNGAGSGRTTAYANSRLYTRGLTNDADTIIDAATGTTVGTYDTDAIPALTSTSGFFLKYDGALLGVDLASQQALWSFTGDGQLVSAPVVVDQTVFVGSRSGTVYALDATTGTQLWQGSAGGTLFPDDEARTGSPWTGISAGEGYLVVPAGNRLTAWKLVN